MTAKCALLALEFSGKHSSVALAVATGDGMAISTGVGMANSNGSETPAEQCAGHRFLQRQSEGPRGRFLLQEVDLLLKQADLPRESLAGILAGIGPGSYTGLRIACAAAHALGFALDIPYAGIGSFEAAVMLAPEGATVHVLQDAYRQQAYYACGSHQQGAVTLHDGPRVLAIDEIPTAIEDEKCFLISDERLSGKLARPENALLRPQAVDLLKIAMQRGVRADGSEWPQMPAAEPLYLRAAAFRPSK